MIIMGIINYVRFEDVLLERVNIQFILLRIREGFMGFIIYKENMDSK